MTVIVFDTGVDAASAGISQYVRVVEDMVCEGMCPVCLCDLDSDLLVVALTRSVPSSIADSINRAVSTKCMVSGEILSEYICCIRKLIIRQFQMSPSITPRLPQLHADQST